MILKKLVMKEGCNKGKLNSQLLSNKLMFSYNCYRFITNITIN